jgi:hypothetical protein
MAVRCAQCGEELLGAVNRCWRCGAQVLSRSGDTDLPPIRRPPVPAPTVAEPAGEPEDVVEASFADAEVAEPAPSSPAAGGTVVEGLPSGTPRTLPTRRVGSPFATRPSNFLSRVTRWLTPDRGAVAACVLGILALFACIIAPPAAVILGVLGLGLGILGLYSRRRGPALVGLLFCSLAILMGVFLVAVFWYESRYGYLPWDAPAADDGVTG